MQELTFDRERAYEEAGFDVVVGVDEAGRGPLAGSVVAAAAALRQGAMNGEQGTTDGEEKEWKLIRDSKTLSEKQRDRAFEFVHEKFFVGVGIVHAETIDRINILEATFLAMKSALSELKIQDTGYKMQKTIVLVDGNMTIPNLSLPQEAVVGGDGIVRSIAAASIIAKVTRDRMMLEYDKEYPLYGFAQHKGYGTKGHMDALRKHGACPIHRMSFKPVFYSIPENVNRNLLSRKRK
ncbi:MAG: ribonuclease HII [Candidatus Moranbacteria bacterium]|nr:ribonuclease HII [Candidatus Moranbacteria bacterium]